MQQGSGEVKSKEGGEMQQGSGVVRRKEGEVDATGKWRGEKQGGKWREGEGGEERGGTGREGRDGEGRRQAVPSLRGRPGAGGGTAPQDRTEVSAGLTVSRVGGRLGEGGKRRRGED